MALPKAEQIQAPWTDEQVLALLKYQTNSFFHPFTCGNEHSLNIFNGLEGHNILVPTNDGWICPHELCDYTQDWCWNWMALPDFTAAIERVIQEYENKEPSDG